MRGSERMRRQSSKLKWITERGPKIGMGNRKACESGMKRLRDYLLAGGTGLGEEIFICFHGWPGRVWEAKIW